MLIHPQRLRPLRVTLIAFARHAAAMVDFDISIQSGLRLEEEQQLIYAKGRTASSGICVCADHPLGIAVTNAAHAVDTPHGRGMAFDFCPVVDGRGLWKDYDKFTVVGQLAKKHGLEWGGDWEDPKDWGHVQMADWRSIPHRKA